MHQSTDERIRLTYRIETAGNIEKLAEKIASDQSTGTFVALPGETEELKDRVAARVTAIRPLEPLLVPSIPPAGRGRSSEPMSISTSRLPPSAPISPP